jgi:hypothetical protein
MADTVTKLTEFKADIPPQGFNSPEDIAAFEADPNYQNNNLEHQTILKEAGLPVPGAIPNPVVSLDSNITVAEQVSPVPTQTTPKNIASTEVVDPSPEDIVNDILGLKKEEPVPNATPEPVQVQEQAVIYNEEYVSSRIAEAIALEREKYTNIEASMQEFAKDPYAFYAKHSPYMLEKFDKAAYINGTLESEFGTDFVVDASQIAIYDSPSNKYMRRQQELANQAENYKTTAQDTISKSEQSAFAKLNEQKTAVMTKYGFQTESDFNPIWDEVIGLSIEEVQDRLVRAKLIESKLVKYKENQSKPVPLPSNGLPSITELGSSPLKAPDKDLQAMESLFSPARMKVLHN